jgi:hypothetical protein
MSIPQLQVRSNTLIEYYPPAFGSNKNRAIQAMLIAKMHEHKTYSGLMTEGSRKRLTKCVELIVQRNIKPRYINNPHVAGSYYHTLAFITLTIHSPKYNVPGNEASKKLLKPFLQWLVRVQGAKDILWKAELQERGQLHYHITTDAFVDYQVLNKKWNYLLMKAGYSEDYFKEHGHYNCPSTHVKKVRNMSDMAGYIKKQVTEQEILIRNAAQMKGAKVVSEITKDIQNYISVGGKVWDCSLHLKREKLCAVDQDYMTKHHLEYAVGIGSIQKIEHKSCTIYKHVKGFGLINYLDNWQRHQYNQHMAAIELNFLTYKEKRKEKKQLLTEPEKVEVKQKIEQLMLFDSLAPPRRHGEFNYYIN